MQVSPKKQVVFKKPELEPLLVSNSESESEAGEIIDALPFSIKIKNH